MSIYNINHFFWYLQCYKRILQLDPINIQGLHNLCVVYVERGKLAKAKDCLQHAHQLAPYEDYILRHLQIVQTRIAKLRQTTGMFKEKEIAFEEFDPKEFGGKMLSQNIDATDKDTETHDKNALPSQIVFDVEDSTKETRKSVSKQEKPQHSQAPIDEEYHQSLSAASSMAAGKETADANLIGGKQPVFIEANTIASKIQEEYRPSNSVQNGINKRRYQQYNQHHHHHHHHHHSSSHHPHSNHQHQHHHQQQQQQPLYHESHVNHRQSKSLIGNDRDDPSSGMS